MTVCINLPAVEAVDADIGRGPYMHSANGRKIYPFSPRAEEINIDTVAHHLACNGRWNGATQHKRFRSRIYFSVAEHSVLVARYLREVMKRPDLELEGLLHDAPEYLLADIIRPIKHHPTVHPIIKPLEDKAELTFAQRFNLKFPLPPAIKVADNAVCAAEKRQIVPRSPLEDWGPVDEDQPVAPYEIVMMEPFEAKQYFIDAFEEAIARRERYASLPQAE